MYKRKRNSQQNNLNTLGIFLILVFFLILISATFRIATLISKSTFDGSHTFNVVFINSKKDSSQIVSFAPDKYSISIVNIKGMKDHASLGKTLKVPIDASVSDTGVINGENIDSILLWLTLKYSNEHTSLTIIDTARLYWYAQSVPIANIAQKSITLPLENVHIDKVSSSSFLDYSINMENVSIHIINGTSVSGLGNRLAKLISNMGGNVILVSNAKDVSISEIAYVDENSYTLKRLKAILRYKTSISVSSMADIVITIGKDSAQPSIF